MTMSRWIACPRNILPRDDETAVSVIRYRHRYRYSHNPTATNTYPLPVDEYKAAHWHSRSRWRVNQRCIKVPPEGRISKLL